jgi:hypothetical protein
MTVGRDEYRINDATAVIYPAPMGMAHMFVELPDGRVFRACPRCLDGTGTIQQHLGVFGGVCLKCHGQGTYTEVAGGRDALPAIVSRRNYQRQRAEAQRLAKVAATAEAAGLRWQAQLDEWHAEALEIDAARDAQRWAAPVGQGVEVTGQVVTSMWIDTRFGATRLVVVDTGDGVVVKTFSTSKAACGLERGDQVTVSGQVKSHEIYRDTKQTVISRPKFSAA